MAGGGRLAAAAELFSVAVGPRYSNPGGKHLKVPRSLTWGETSWIGALFPLPAGRGEQDTGRWTIYAHISHQISHNIRGCGVGDVSPNADGPDR